MRSYVVSLGLNQIILSNLAYLVRLSSPTPTYVFSHTWSIYHIQCMLSQGRPSHEGNEAEIFMIPILGGKIWNFREEQIFLSI